VLSKGEGDGILTTTEDLSTSSGCGEEDAPCAPQDECRRALAAVPGRNLRGGQTLGQGLRRRARENLGGIAARAAGGRRGCADGDGDGSVQVQVAVGRSN
jgi:hypothetical protein